MCTYLMPDLDRRMSKGMVAMNDFTILHLSDLHIGNTDGNYSRILHNLIKDIETQIEQLKLLDNTLIICVTGDVFHRGNTKQNEYDSVLKFFQDLRVVIGDKCAGIYIVPGNHDHKRIDENEFLIMAYRGLINSQMCYKTILEGHKEIRNFDDIFKNKLWPIHLNGYGKKEGSGYLELIQEVYKLYNTPVEEEVYPPYINNTFGVDIKKINGQHYCFILLNTSWSCTNDNDNNNIILGRFQLDLLKQEFHQKIKELQSEDMNIRDKIITIVVGHHPLGAIHSLEEDNVFGDMISFEEFDANIYLCGHTHERDIISWANNRHSLDTYVTGIGWPETPTRSSVKRHSYSIYVFNTSLNSIDIKVRSTNDLGNFSNDMGFYDNVNRRPINAAITQSSIKLSTALNGQEKVLYWNKKLLEYSKEYGLNINRLNYAIAQYINGEKINLCTEYSLENQYAGLKTTDILQQYLFGTGASKKGRAILAKEQADRRYRRFKGLLQCIANNFLEYLAKPLMNDNDVMRVHFRHFYKEKGKITYKCICHDVYPHSVNGVDLLGEHVVSDMVYGDLLKASFEANKGLIYSVNHNTCGNRLNEKWANFITIVPNFPMNIVRVKSAQGIENSYPMLTFGITCNSNSADQLFYCMDYFEFKKELELILSSFIDRFVINVLGFCKDLGRNYE